VGRSPTVHAPWWSPALKLGSVEEIPSALTRPFEDAFEVAGPDGATDRIASCTDYQRLRPLGYAPLDQTSFGALQEQAVRCQSLFVLQRGNASRNAELLILLGMPDLLSFLPASMAPADSNDERKRRAAAQAAGEGWSAYDTTLRLLKQHAQRAELAGATGKTQLELYAAGDFDGDGAQDALIKGLSFGDEGTWLEMRLWLVARPPGGRLRVVEELAL
jgi:hypothetical protein